METFLKLFKPDSPPETKIARPIPRVRSTLVERLEEEWEEHLSQAGSPVLSEKSLSVHLPAKEPEPWSSREVEYDKPLPPVLAVPSPAALAASPATPPPTILDKREATFTPVPSSSASPRIYQKQHHADSDSLLANVHELRDELVMEQEMLKEGRGRISPLGSEKGIILAHLTDKAEQAAGDITSSEDEQRHQGLVEDVPVKVAYDEEAALERKGPSMVTIPMPEKHWEPVSPRMQAQFYESPTQGKRHYQTPSLTGELDGEEEEEAHHEHKRRKQAMSEAQRGEYQRRHWQSKREHDVTDFFEPLLFDEDFQFIDSLNYKKRLAALSDEEEGKQEGQSEVSSLPRHHHENAGQRVRELKEREEGMQARKRNGAAGEELEAISTARGTSGLSFRDMLLLGLSKTTEKGTQSYQEEAELDNRESDGDQPFETGSQVDQELEFMLGQDQNTARVSRPRDNRQGEGMEARRREEAGAELEQLAPSVARWPRHEGQVAATHEEPNPQGGSAEESVSQRSEAMAKCSHGDELASEEMASGEGFARRGQGNRHDGMQGRQKKVAGKDLVGEAVPKQPAGWGGERITRVASIGDGSRQIGPTKAAAAQGDQPVIIEIGAVSTPVKEALIAQMPVAPANSPIHIEFDHETMQDIEAHNLHIPRFYTPAQHFLYDPTDFFEPHLFDDEISPATVDESQHEAAPAVKEVSGEEASRKQGGQEAIRNYVEQETNRKQGEQEAIRKQGEQEASRDLVQESVLPASMPTRLFDEPSAARITGLTPTPPHYLDDEADALRERQRSERWADGEYQRMMSKVQEQTSNPFSSEGDGTISSEFDMKPVEHYENDQLLIDALEATEGEFNGEGREYDWDYWRQMLFLGAEGEEDWLEYRWHLADPAFAGVPAALRGEVWATLVADEADAELYQTLLAEPCPWSEAIEQDLRHVLPPEHVDAQGRLERLLRAYSVYDREVGYRRGMAFPAAVITLQVVADEPVAFALYCRLMFTHDLRSCYWTPSDSLQLGEQADGLALRRFQLAELIRQRLPALHHHLQRHGGNEVEDWVAPLLLTGFAHRWPMDLVNQLYDVLLIEGLALLGRFAVALLADNEERLLAINDTEHLRAAMADHLLLLDPVSGSRSWICLAMQHTDINAQALEDLAAEYEDLVSQSMEISTLTGINRLRQENHAMMDMLCKLTTGLHVALTDRERLMRELIEHKLELIDSRCRNYEQSATIHGLQQGNQRPS